MHLAFVGKNQQVIFGGGNEKMLDEIFFLYFRSGGPFAAALLFAVSAYRQALDISAVADCYHHVFFGNQIFYLQLFRFPDYIGPAFIAVFFF